MAAAAAASCTSNAVSYRDLLRTMEDIERRQRIAAAQGDDTDVLAVSRRGAAGGGESVSLARRARGGSARILWEDLDPFDAKEFVTSLLKQLYLEAEYLSEAIPRAGRI